MIGGVEIFEDPDIPEDQAYIISRVKPNMRKDGLPPFVTMKFSNDPFFYKKPKWYQWRLRRKYKKILETK